MWWSRQRRNSAIIVLAGMFAANSTALASPSKPSSLTPTSQTEGVPAFGVAWQPRALRSEQQLADVCAAAPWQATSVGGSTLDRLDGVRLNAQRGASFWAAPASVTRIILTQGNCKALTVARRVGDADNFVTAQTQLPVIDFTDHRRGVTLIEPAGPGAAVWLSCAEPSVVIAQELEEIPVRLAWEQARVAVRTWINSSGQSPQPPTVIPGDDGSLAAELQAAAWLAQFAPRQLRATWRLAAAETAFARARPSSDPYVDAIDRVPSNVPTQANIVVDEQIWGVLATPWQIEVTGPAQLQWWLMQPLPTTGWHDQTATATLTLDGATQVHAQQVAMSPAPVMSRATAFPAPVDPRWGRRVSWTVAVPPGRHMVALHAAPTAATDAIVTRVRVIVRQPRWRDAAPDADATVYRTMQTALRGDGHVANPTIDAVAMLLQVYTPASAESQVALCIAAMQASTLPVGLQPWLAQRCDRIVLQHGLAQSELMDEHNRHTDVETARATWQHAPWHNDPRTAYLAAQRAAAWQAVPASGANAAASQQLWAMPRSAGPAISASTDITSSDVPGANAIALALDGQPHTITLRNASPGDLRLPLLRLDIGRDPIAVRFPDIKIDGHSYTLATRDTTGTVVLALAPGPHTIAVANALFAIARGPIVETSTVVRRLFVDTSLAQQFTVANASIVLIDFRPVMAAHPDQRTASVTLIANGGQTFQITAVAKRLVANAVSLQHGTALADLPTIALAFAPGTNVITSEARPGGLLRLKQLAPAATRTTAIGDTPATPGEFDHASLAFPEVLTRITALSRQLTTDGNDVTARLDRAELLAAQGLIAAARIDLTVLAGFTLREDLMQRYRATLANLQGQTTAQFLPVQPATSPVIAGTMLAPVEAAATLDVALTDADQAALIAELLTKNSTTPAVATLHRLYRRYLGAPTVDDLLNLGQHPHHAVRLAALQWVLEYPTPAVAPLAYVIAQTLASVNEFAAKRAVLQTLAITQWDTLRSVSAQAGYESVWLPTTNNREPLDQIRHALLAAPWPAHHGVVLDAGQSLTLRDQDAAAIELFCAPERNGDCTVNIRRNQTSESTSLAAGQRQTVTFQAPINVPMQLEVALLSPRSKLALRLLDANGVEISALMSPRPTFLAQPKRPVRITTLGPTSLHITALGYASPYDAITVDVQGVSQPGWFAVSSVVSPSIKVVSNRTSVLTAPSEYEIAIWQPGPVTVELTPTHGTVALHIQRRSANVNAAAPTNIEPATTSIAATSPPPNFDPAPRWTAPWRSTPQLLASAAPPGPTYSVLTLAGRESLGELESDLADVNSRIEVSIQARAANRYGFALLSVRGRQVLGTGATETMRVLVNSRRGFAGVAWTADALLGHGTDADTQGWMARGSLLAKRPIFLSRRWRIVPALAVVAAQAPIPITTDADPLIFSRYRNDHPLQLQASGLVLWQPLADQRLSARFEGWSNSDGASIDTALAQFAWYGLLEWQPLRGPVFALRYQPSYRFVDANRSTGIWRHDALAGLIWPLGHLYGAWTLGVDLDIYKSSDRGLSNSLAFWLRWDTGGRGMLDFRPDEFIFADYLGATAWRQ